MELPHWLILGGTFLILAGLTGLVLSRNKEIEPDDEPTSDPQ